MRAKYIILLAACSIALLAARAERPLFQAELDVTNAVEYIAGQAYRVDGRVIDRSVLGYVGDSVRVGDLVFTESILGDVDAWRVTNIVFASALHVRLDVAYLPDGETNGIGGMPIGPAALCTIATNTDIGFPQPPSMTGALVSEHLLNEIRSYSFRLIPGTWHDYGLGEVVTNLAFELATTTGQVASIASDVAALPQGATIAAGDADSVTRSGTNLVITWNTNAAGGGGSGDASLWYEYPALTQVEFRARSADLTTTGAPWTVGPYLLHSNAFEIAHEGTAFVQVDTNGQLIVSGDIYGNGVSLADTLSRAVVGSYLGASAYTVGTGAAAVAASVRADFDPTSNTVSTLKAQFDGSSNTWLKLNGSTALTGNLDMGGNSATNIGQLRAGTGTFDKVVAGSMGLTGGSVTGASSYAVAGGVSRWQLGSSLSVMEGKGPHTNNFNTVVSSNKVIFTERGAKPTMPGWYLITACPRMKGTPNASGLFLVSYLTKNHNIFAKDQVVSGNINLSVCYPTVSAIAYSDGDDLFQVKMENYWVNTVTNDVSSDYTFDGIYLWSN